MREFLNLNQTSASPSFEALSGGNNKASFSELEFKKDASRIIAFYLPQFHEVPENSKWWGPGFTDWVNVAKARPTYTDHYQPHIPEELGFYDASLEETLIRQAKLAKEYGVYGFCFYWYWFNGVRILHKPITTFLDSGIDLNYCFCWANEPWTRTWDNNTGEVLIQQEYPEGFEKNFVSDLLPHWRQDRYITVDGRPLLIIYRLNHIPNTSLVLANIRSESVEQFGVNPYIVGVDFYDLPDEKSLGLDAVVEFPPHKFWGINNEKTPPLSLDVAFTGKVVDYRKVLLQSVSRLVGEGRKIYRACIPSWDNTPRLGMRAVIIENTNPFFFEIWLKALRQYTRKNLRSEENFIFINAWNEWAEGAHLEPDLKNGRSFLEAIKKSEHFSSDQDFLNIEYLKNELDISEYALNSNVFFDSSHYQTEFNSKQRIKSMIFNLSPYLYRFLRSLYGVYLRNRGK